uniref:Uncharacterized protein LOC102805671 n=1 Tax=Saccoglossus kowalevskii TaxID=10224 RepID=A0ABM0LW33_SACKO|nr:PREDICTED: uncharacterized protein LOC102805671 [Saccoglossus kowalevskii]
MEDDTSWCDNCQKLRGELDRVREEQTLNCTVVKQKIINTDRLIKQYSRKCQEYDAQSKKLDDATNKLMSSERDCQALQVQLESMLVETGRLKQEIQLAQNSNTELAKQKTRIENEHMGCKLLIQQLEISLQEKEDGEAEMKLKCQMFKDELDKNRVEMARKEKAVNKFKANLDSSKNKVQELKKNNKQLENELAMVKRKLEKYEVHNASRALQSLTRTNSALRREARGHVNVIEDGKRRLFSELQSVIDFSATELPSQIMPLSPILSDSDDDLDYVSVMIDTALDIDLTRNERLPHLRNSSILIDDDESCDISSLLLENAENDPQKHDIASNAHFVDTFTKDTETIFGNIADKTDHESESDITPVEDVTVIEMEDELARHSNVSNVKHEKELTSHDNVGDVEHEEITSHDKVADVKHEKELASHDNVGDVEHEKELASHDKVADVKHEKELASHDNVADVEHEKELATHENVADVEHENLATHDNVADVKQETKLAIHDNIADVECENIGDGEHEKQLASHENVDDVEHENELASHDNVADVEHEKELATHENVADVEHGKELAIHDNVADVEHETELAIHDNVADVEHETELAIHDNVADVEHETELAIHDNVADVEHETRRAIHNNVADDEQETNLAIHDNVVDDKHTEKLATQDSVTDGKLASGHDVQHKNVLAIHGNVADDKHEKGLASYDNVDDVEHAEKLATQDSVTDGKLASGHDVQHKNVNAIHGNVADDEHENELAIHDNLAVVKHSKGVVSHDNVSVEHEMELTSHDDVASAEHEKELAIHDNVNVEHESELPRNDNTADVKHEKELASYDNVADVKPEKELATHENVADVEHENLATHDNVADVKQETELAIHDNVNVEHERDTIMNNGELVDTMINNGDLGDTMMNNGELGDTMMNNGKLGDTMMNNGELGDTMMNNEKLGDTLMNNGELGDTMMNNGEPGDTMINNRDLGDTMMNNGELGDTMMNNGKLGDTMMNNGELGDTMMNNGKLGDTMMNNGELGDTMMNDGELGDTMMNTDEVRDTVIERMNIVGSPGRIFSKDDEKDIVRPGECHKHVNDSFERSDKGGAVQQIFEKQKVIIVDGKEKEIRMERKRKDRPVERKTVRNLTDMEEYVKSPAKKLVKCSVNGVRNAGVFDVEEELRRHDCRQIDSEREKHPGRTLERNKIVPRHNVRPSVPFPRSTIAVTSFVSVAVVSRPVTSTRTTSISPVIVTSTARDHTPTLKRESTPLTAMSNLTDFLDPPVSPLPPSPVYCRTVTPIPSMVSPLPQTPMQPVLSPLGDIIDNTSSPITPGHTRSSHWRSPCKFLVTAPKDAIPVMPHPPNASRSLLHMFSNEPNSNKPSREKCPTSRNTINLTPGNNNALKSVKPNGMSSTMTNSRSSFDMSKLSGNFTCISSKRKSCTVVTSAPKKTEPTNVEMSRPACVTDSPKPEVLNAAKPDTCKTAEQSVALHCKSSTDLPCRETKNLMSFNSHLPDDLTTCTEEDSTPQQNSFYSVAGTSTDGNFEPNNKHNIKMAEKLLFGSDESEKEVDLCTEYETLERDNGVRNSEKGFQNPSTTKKDIGTLWGELAINKHQIEQKGKQKRKKRNRKKKKKKQQQQKIEEQKKLMQDEKIHSLSSIEGNFISDQVVQNIVSKIRQMNTEAAVVAVLQAILQYTESTSYDLMPAIAAKCWNKNNNTQPVIALMEEHIVMELANKIKRTSQTVQTCLLQGLHNAVMSHTQLMPCIALCRIYTGVSRLCGFKECVCVLCYDIFRENRQDRLHILLSIVGVWPMILQKQDYVQPVLSALGLVTGLELKAIANQQQQHVMVNYMDLMCGWKLTGELKAETICMELIKQIRERKLVLINSQSQGVLTPLGFEIIKALELLAVHQGWEWCNNWLIREAMWPILREWGQKLKMDKNTDCSSVIMVFDVIRATARSGLLENKSSVCELLKMLCSVLYQDGVPWCVQCSVARCVLHLALADPNMGIEALNKWMSKVKRPLESDIKDSFQKLKNCCKS